MLSAMQQRIYDYIAACIQTQGYPPSVREIGEAVGLRSPSTVHFHLKKLADAGVIEIGAGKGRAITLTHPAAPSVPEPEDTGHPGDVHFALRVRGESMLNAGILPGDLVVVRQQQTCNQGEIVVAMIDDEATVKRFSRKNGHIWLLPENDDYEPIDGTYAQILGKVVAVVRQY